MIVVIGNAAITGVLSTVDDRYQARVIWLAKLVPLLAGVLELSASITHHPLGACRSSRGQTQASLIALTRKLGLSALSSLAVEWKAFILTVRCCLKPGDF